jgi:hypothetical protein
MHMRGLLLLVLVLAGCTSAPLPTSTASTADTRPARSAAESTECAYSLLSSFIDAFNRGDATELTTFFSTTRGTTTFKWFVTPETPAYGPGISQLPHYFATWRSAGERWRVASVEAGASPGWHGGVDFAMEIERTWPDRSTLNGGKGALDCDARKIFVFSLGDAVR